MKDPKFVVEYSVNGSGISTADLAKPERSTNHVTENEVIFSEQVR